MKISFKLFGLLIATAVLISACGGSAKNEGAAAGGKTLEYTLTTGMAEGKLVYIGVGGGIDGVPNPILSANAGDTVKITLSNGDGIEHDISFPDFNGTTERVAGKGSTVTIAFGVDKGGSFAYFSTLPGQREKGMEGKFNVSGESLVVVDSQSSPQTVTLAAFQKGGCGACHSIPGIPSAVGMIGPDLSKMNEVAGARVADATYTGKATNTDEYIRESILDPNLFVAPTCPTGACPPNVMPAALADTLATDEINSIVKYLNGLPAGAFSDSTAAADTAPQAPTTGVDVVRDPTDLPAPLEIREPTTVIINLEAVEVEGQLADGTTFTYWTFNNAVPGPFFRVRLGDTIEVHMKNNTSSVMNHSVDFHAVTGPGGGAVMTQTTPGEETMFTAKAINVGLFVYHCATPMVAQHIANGMYGLILVEPEGGLPPVDREFYVMQGEVYTTEDFGTQGHLNASTEALLDENPEYLVFNGAVGALTTQKPLKANVGETVRIFFGVGGPNFTSSFHVIGEIFDRVYNLASLTSAPLTDVQTTLVPPGGATMVEFGLEVPGNYILVDHALARLQRGLAGFLVVEGPENPEIFNGTPMPGSGH